MAKDKIKKDLDQIDLILNEIGDNELEFDDFESSKGKREGISGVVKNLKDGFLSSTFGDPATKMTNFIDNAMPRAISKEYDFLKDVHKQTMATIEQSTKEIKGSAKQAVDIIRSRLDSEGKLGKLLGKLNDKLSTESSYSGSSGPSEDEIVSNTLNDLFNREQEADNQREEIREGRENARFQANHLQTTRLATSVEHLLKFHNQYTLNYYKKSIELKLKTLFVNKELLEVTKTSSEAMIKQFESIVHNTSLPDLIKLRNSEQFEETLKVRMRENMADMFLSALTPLNVFKQGIQDKVSNTMNNLVEGIKTGVDALDMMNDLSFGDSSSKIIGSLAGSKLHDVAAKYTSQALESNPQVKEYLKKIKLFMADPTETFFDLAEKEEEKNTTISRWRAEAFRELAYMAQTKSVENKRFIEGAPDDPTHFDYKTKNSIVKIIPSILGKIYGEVRSIRTGEAPVTLQYDYSTGKLETSDTFSKRLERKVELGLETGVKSKLDTFMSTIDKESELSENERRLIGARIVNHVSRGGSVSPKSLAKDGFLDTLPTELRDKFKSKIDSFLDTSNNKFDAFDMETASRSMFDVKTNIPHIDNIIQEFYNNGQIEDAIRMGILNYDEYTGAYTVNKDKYANIINKLMLKGTKSNFTVKTDDIANKVNDVDRLSKIDLRGNRYKNLHDRYDFAKAPFTNQYHHNQFVKQRVVDGKVDILYVDPTGTISRDLNSNLHFNTKASIANNEAVMDNKPEKVKETTWLNEILNKDTVDADTMQKAFQEAHADARGSTLDEYAATLGYEKNGSSYVRSKRESKVTELRKSMIDHLIGYFHEFSGKIGKLKNFKDLFGITPDMTPLMAMHQVIQTTRRWDRKIVLSIPKYIGKSIKSLWNVGKAILKGGFGALTSPLTRNLVGMIFGISPKHDSIGNRHEDNDGNKTILEAVHDTIQKSRDLDPKIVKKLLNIPGILKGSKDFISNLFNKRTKTFKGVSFIRDLFGTIVGRTPTEREGYLMDRVLSSKEEFETERERLRKSILKRNKRRNTEMTDEEVEKIIDTTLSKKFSNYMEMKIGKEAKDRERNENIFGFDKNSIEDGDSTFSFSNLKRRSNQYKDDILNKLKDHDIDLSNINMMSKFKMFMSGLFAPKVKGDADGDGDRDGNWKERLDTLNLDKDTKETLKDSIKGEGKGLGAGWKAILGKVSWLGGLLLAPLKAIMSPIEMISKITMSMGTAITTGIPKILKILGKIPALLIGKFNPVTHSGMKDKVLKGASILGTAGIGYAITEGMEDGSEENAVNGLGLGIAATKMAAQSSIAARALEKANKTKMGHGIIDTIKKMKEIIIKKIGPKAGGFLITKLGAMLAARLVPFAGWALLAYDVTAITKHMLADGLSFGSAVSKHLLGYDIFDDTEPIRDENGNPIRPDEDLNSSNYSEEDLAKMEVERLARLDNPRLKEYIDMLFTLTKKEEETGVKDMDMRRQLVEFKREHKLNDNDIRYLYFERKRSIDTKKKEDERNLDTIINDGRRDPKVALSPNVYDNKKYFIDKTGTGLSAAEAQYNMNVSNQIRSQHGTKYQEVMDSSKNKVLDHKPIGVYGNGTSIDMIGKIDNSKLKSKEAILNMLDDVASKTGVDATLLKSFAAIESGFNTKAQASTSSAGGLFQFIDTTWKHMLKTHGSKYGLGLDTPKSNAYANSLMGAEYVKENARILSKIGRGSSLTDLYLAHFLGPGGAMALLKASPDTPVDRIIGSASLNANQSIFYNNLGNGKNFIRGRIKTAGEVFNWADKLVRTKLKGFGITSNIPESVDFKNVESVSAIPPNTISSTTDTLTYNKTSSDYLTSFNTSSTTLSTPNVSSSSNSYMDKQLDNDILEKSLNVQIKMETHLKNIYEYLSKNKSNDKSNYVHDTVPTNHSTTNNIVNNNVAISNDMKETLAFKAGALDLSKKRF